MLSLVLTAAAVFLIGNWHNFVVSSLFLLRISIMLMYLCSPGKTEEKQSKK